jgi:cell division protein FtsW
MRANVKQRPFKFELKVDPILMTIVVLLASFGLLMIYSTTGVLRIGMSSDSLFFLKKQIFHLIIGFVAMLTCALIPIRVFKKLSTVFYFIALFLLLLVLIPGIGQRAGGAQRWASFGFFRFQPGEFSKLFIIIAFAGLLERRARFLKQFKGGLLKLILVLLPPFIIFLLQDDFGSCAVIAGVCVCMAITAGLGATQIIFGTALGTFGALGAIAIEPYRLVRIKDYLFADGSTHAMSYQLKQSFIALGSGQVFGLGLGSSQQKFYYLPAAHTDFIFAVIGEELGFVGCTALVLIIGAFMLRSLQVARRLSADTFASCLAVGVSFLLVLPSFLNIGVVTGLLPTKGLVLPLIGYGGSSVIASLACIGVLFSLYKYAFGVSSLNTTQKV